MIAVICFECYCVILRGDEDDDDDDVCGRVQGADGNY